MSLRVSPFYINTGETERIPRVSEYLGCPANWLQVIFCKSIRHWVVASTIACELGMVKVFDSLSHKLDEESTRTICKKNTKIKLVGISHKQVGSKDCGVFAIAYCTSLAFRKDPCKQKFVQEKMRYHLSTCLKNDRFIIIVFPL